MLISFDTMVKREQNNFTQYNLWLKLLTLQYLCHVFVSYNIAVEKEKGVLKLIRYTKYFVAKL